MSVKQPSVQVLIGYKLFMRSHVKQSIKVIGLLILTAHYKTVLTSIERYLTLTLLLRNKMLHVHDTHIKTKTAFAVYLYNNNNMYSDNNNNKRHTKKTTKYSVKGLAVMRQSQLCRKSGSKSGQHVNKHVPPLPVNCSVYRQARCQRRRIQGCQPSGCSECKPTALHV